MDKSALSRATDPTSAPTPGYLYNDIGISLISPSICIETLRFLMAKLSKNNPHVKRKVLKIIAKAAAHPGNRGRFKRCIAQDAQVVAAIRECVTWRGTMDAVTGDQWNVDVREAAKECLEVIYSEDVDPVGGSGMTGLGGGTAYGAPMGGTAGMQGMGNPMYSDPRMTGPPTLADMTITEVATNVGSAVMEMIKDPLARSVPEFVAQVRGGYGGPAPPMRPDPYAQTPPGRNNLALQTGGQWTMASNRGPNAVGSSSNAIPTISVSSAPSQQNSEYYKAANAGPAFQWAASGGSSPAPSGVPSIPSAPAVGGVGGSWGSPVLAPAQTQMSVAARSRAEAHGTVPSQAPIHLGVATSNNQGSHEKKLIAELCPPGGMKAEPPQDKLEEFARTVPTLNADWVCPALLDALEEGNPWIMRAKALCVIETVLNVMAQASEGGSNAYADFFHACSDEITPLANHARIAVKAPAKRVLSALGLSDVRIASGEPGAGRSAEVATVAAAAPAPNLLDFDDSAPTVVAAPVAPPPAVPTVSQPAGSSVGDSLFSGLNTKTVAPAPPAPVQIPQVQVNVAQEDDLLGRLNATPEVGKGSVLAAAPSSRETDLFGDAGVKPVENGMSNATQPSDAPSSGSAFGFMNSTAPSAPAADVPMAPSTPVPQPQTFDPLLSLGVPGSSTPSPGPANPNRMAQMQATMAYQQQMMMMQQQMQQMQMAYGAGPGAGANFIRPGSAGVPPFPMGNPRMNVMGANYMRQVPGVQGDNMTSFSFLGAEAKKPENHSFDFVKDAMKKG